MPRFRAERTLPRLLGTKDKYEHDALHLVETARVKINKARVRLPDHLSPFDLEALDTTLARLQDDVETFKHTIQHYRKEQHDVA